MKLYPEDIEEKIGFDQIRGHLISFCGSEKGASLAAKMKPSSDIEVIEKWLQQVKEMRLIKSESGHGVSFDFIDFEPYLVKIKVAGTFLDPSDLHDLNRGIKWVSGWTTFFQKHSGQYPCLEELSERIEIDPKLSATIEAAIDERGEVRDTASAELSTIRRQITKSEQSVRSAIEKILKKAKTDEMTDEDSTLTVREGRLVIPVKAEYKKRIPGFVHDESATGQTVFLEPGEVLSLNNQVQELHYRERREVIRILTTLSDRIRENMQGLLRSSGMVEKLDFIYAKVKLQELLDGTLPTIKKTPLCNLVHAKHPLLSLSHRGTTKPVVPLNLLLDATHRILIISGPNAGGKSVALKTVGLLQYMVQCGLPVSAGEESTFGLFHALFLDIGDTQSIEDDLSTYSAHLTAMKYFMDEAGGKTLFLIDEFGKGTDPQFGGAIAASVLQRLNQKKALGMITTHYQNLKKMGDETEGLVNGAMKYDQEALTPLFELEVGKPGSSFAFEIAGKIGLPETIIAHAKKSIGDSRVDYDQALNQLEKEKGRYEKLQKQLSEEKQGLQKLKKDYEALRDMLETDRNRIVKEAKKEARQVLDGANKEVERVIREIKESKAAKAQTSKARKSLEDKKNDLADANPPSKVQPIRTGDRVAILGQESTGSVIKINGKQVEVLFGGMKSIVSMDRLEKVMGSPQSKHHQKVKKLGIDVNKKMAHFKGELSIRGMRAEEAMGQIETYLDEALLVGVDEVRVLHGKGHGVLREMVRSISKAHPRVSSVSDEHADRGGAGISIIRFK